MTMSKSNNASQKWIVGIHEREVPTGRTIGKIFKAKDPGTGDVRDYAFMSLTNNNNDSYVAEFQSMAADFSSFIVGRHVVRDGDLYVINRVDPLFFYLSTQSIDEQNQRVVNDDNNRAQPKKQSWQPYDQFLEQSELPLEITKVICEKQLQHICSTFENDELFFKFSVDKTLKWLQKKQERVLETLVGQHQRRQDRDDSIASKKRDQMGGSISANFNFGNSNPVVTSAQENNNTKSQSKPDTNALKVESLQIICNYLDQMWSKKFVEHVGFTLEEITSTKTAKKSSDVSKHNTTCGKGSYGDDKTTGSSPKNVTPPNKKAVSIARTVGNKRLAKLNTKGMKSIGSFFGASKPKKAKR